MKHALAWTAHRLGGGTLLLRLLLFELVWLLPRQPVAYWISFSVPRFIEIRMPALYPYIGPFFDADLTPAFWLATVLVLVATGARLSPRRSKMDTKRKSAKASKPSPSSRSEDAFPLWYVSQGRFITRMLTLTLIFTPIAWAIRVGLSAQAAARVRAELQRAFPQVANEDKETFALESPFSLQAHVTNTFGGFEPIEPNFTLPFKRVETEHESMCGPESWMVSLPGDTYFVSNRRETEQGNLKLDVYHPRAPHRSGRSPIVLHVHGGGWRKGDRSFIRINYHGGLPKFLLETGFTIVSVSYRLACMGIEPMDMVADIKDAIEYVQRNAALWGANPDAIIPLGTSAGGHLVLLAALRNNMRAVRGVVSLYGVAELRKDDLLSRLPLGWAGLHAQFFVEATRHVCHVHTFDSEDECFREISPLAHVHAKAPPVLMIHAVSDPLVLIEQARWLNASLGAAGVPAALVEVVGSHDCDAHVSSLCAQTTLYAFERFAKAVLPAHAV
ncbi:Liver carboxylesterase 1 [Hondaea fermentalgiana]|uniref:Liver carboxylesterase 1 n=1 Tax=Hondaea fermentalgiana TaxID=2315210 RepID=A0A2R5GXH0_9STRA|nr:Liver carboxylesterase 1 [Hondaea fermentalgiana]|eukprot:GBG33393.1 Liver carboxylesterase 1 [Hondaea fermentalgiana]